LAAFAVVIAVMPSAAFCQSPAGLRTIGVLALSRADLIDALFESLGELGWIDGKTIQVLFPDASPDPARIEANMQTLLAAKPDVVVAQTKLAIQIAKQATDAVPIVMGALNGDPVAEGFVQSLQHPGGNITGSYYNVTDGGSERVAVLADLMPNMTHIGIVMNPASRPSMALADDLAAASGRRGFTVTMMGVRGGDEVDRAFASAKAQGVEGVVVVTGAEMFAIRRDIVAAQNKYRIPAVTGSIGYAEMGGLAKLGPDIPALWRKMAPTIDQLLKGAAKPADLPLVTVDRFELEINLAAAQSLGLTVPEAIRGRAVRLYQ
jgi:putative tryptophan/tyrosine transport system substrate-binding protein